MESTVIKFKTMKAFAWAILNATLLVPYSLITPLKVTAITQANLIEGHCSFFHCSQLRTDFSPEIWENKPALSLTVLTKTFWSTEARIDR